MLWKSAELSWSRQVGPSWKKPVFVRWAYSWIGFAVIPPIPPAKKIFGAKTCRGFPGLCLVVQDKVFQALCWEPCQDGSVLIHCQQGVSRSVPCTWDLT